MSLLVNRQTMKEHLGEETGVSDWFQIDQARINAFADATLDHQYIHVDPERAAKGPFGTTIAHGFLTLSLLVPLVSDVGCEVEDRVTGINYGFDKIRFLSPVKVNDRIRARVKLLDVDEKKPKQFLIKQEVTVEIEGSDKPALIAEWLKVTITA